jgi:hypothetical protein
MTPKVLGLAAVCSILCLTAPAAGQSNDAEERATRDRLGALLRTYGPTVKIDFRQSDKQEFNFIGSLTEGLSNADSFEVVLSVTPDQTIAVHCYPHYHGNYINVDKARNPSGLMRRLLNFGYRNFYPWAADDSGDVLARFQFTLESGFPAEGINVVLKSIKRLDEYVGEMRPDIDGSSAR